MLQDFYPPSQNTTGMLVDECIKHKLIATARCHPKKRRISAAACSGRAQRVKSEVGGEDGYFNGTTGLPVGIHYGKYCM